MRRGAARARPRSSSGTCTFSRARQRRDQLERLEDESDLLGAQAGAPVLVERAEILAVEMDRAAGGPVESGEQAEQRGLAAARGSDDGHERARLHVERDIVQHGERAAAGRIRFRERGAAQHAVNDKQVWVGRSRGGRRLRRAGRAAQAAVATPTRPRAARARVVFLGTSLTAGFGLDASEAYPALIQQKIDSAGLPFEAVNAGVSGETSAGALRRIDWLLTDPPAVLVIETGANDGLRGQDVDSLEANIQAIIDRANGLTPRPRVVLAGMRMLSNYGADYIGRFEDVYPELARRNGLPLVPFLLDGVAGVDSLNQPDQIHPTAAGQRLVAETVWRTLKPVLESEASRRQR